MMKEEHIDLFEAYLAEECSVPESEAFKKRLNEDSILKNEFIKYLQIQESLAVEKRMDIKSTLSSLDSKLNLELQEQLSIEEFEEPVKKGPVLQYLAAAAVIALAFGLWNHYSTQDFPNMEEYWISEPGLPVKMNATGRYDDAMNAYKLGEYQEAEEMLRNIDSDTSEYFLAHTLYLLGDNKAAQEHLLQVPENSVFHHKSIYLSALLDLNEGKHTMAKEKLQTLTEDPALAPKVQKLLHEVPHP